MEATRVTLTKATDDTPSPVRNPSNVAKYAHESPNKPPAGLITKDTYLSNQFGRYGDKLMG